MPNRRPKKENEIFQRRLVLFVKPLKLLITVRKHFLNFIQKCRYYQIFINIGIDFINN